MKIKQKTRDKYAWYLSLCRDSVRPLKRVAFSENGRSAIECFHLLESAGKHEPCREPELLERFIAGKQWHGVTIEQIAESYVFDRTITSEEIKKDYPAWVGKEVFAFAEKKALNDPRIGYVPKFVSEAMDYSEREPLE